MGMRLRLPTLAGREEQKYKPRVFDRRLLRKIFRLKRVEVRGEWRRLHKQELYNLYSTPNTIRVMKSRRWAGHVVRMGDRRCTYRVLMWSSDWKRQLGRSRRRWKCNIKMCIQEATWGYLDLTAPAQHTERWWALVNAVSNFRVPELYGIS
jgi:hypothetical protein